MSSGLPRVLDRLIPLIDTPFLYGLQGYLGLARAPLSDSDLTLRTLAVVATGVLSVQSPEHNTLLLFVPPCRFFQGSIF